MKLGALLLIFLSHTRARSQEFPRGLNTGRYHHLSAGNSVFEYLLAPRIERVQNDDHADANGWSPVKRVPLFRPDTLWKENSELIKGWGTVCEYGRSRGEGNELGFSEEEGREIVGQGFDTVDRDIAVSKFEPSTWALRVHIDHVIHNNFRDLRHSKFRLDDSASALKLDASAIFDFWLRLWRSPRETDIGN